MERLQQIKCFLFDMDGTIYLGDEVFPGIPDFFRRLTELGRQYYFVTNNSSLNHQRYREKLTRLGISASEENILISSDALINEVRRIKRGASLFVLGTPELQDLLRIAGFRLLDIGSENPDYVVLGFDKTLSYARLAHACRLLDKGVPLLATHPDVRCPIEGGEFIPDTGAMLALIESATGVKPQCIYGKPYPYLVKLVQEKGNYTLDQIAMVGDRLHTDIQFGLSNHILSILVLTGESTQEDMVTRGIYPDVVLERAVDILKYIS